ncbi:hypothetical protein LINPERHAP2_LOCUS19416 [Linum perenne]
MIMKSSNFIISMLIPGPESPGDAIDVYLQPLIAELKELWEVGIQTFDASKRQNFQLHAALMWTINDFPAYGNLSGWSTKGRLACPACNMDTMSTWLYKGAEFCYMGHRRWLPTGHRWRRDKESFDGTKEKRIQPRSFSGDDLLSQMQDLEGIPLTKCTKTKVKIDHKFRGDNWNKKSIFFCLPYWKSNLLRHNLDVMHIEKNVCDNVLGTIMNLAGKTKDTLKTRLDLEAMGIRKDLHPIREGNKVSIPHATYTLSQDMKREFCQFLKKLKVPDGFSSNISQCVNVNERKISGMKSHDCHVLLQHVIPLAIRGLLPKEVCEPIIELSIYFRSLCSKSLHLDQLEQLKKQIPLTLCKLEKIFPPAFFDVMVHLPIHLADEAMLGGPVQYRWMYPIERYLYQLKSFVRNRTHPEGSIAEGYIAFECMTLCSRYLSDISTRFNKPDRNFDGGDMTEFLSFSQVGRTLGVGALRIFSMKEVEQAHIYVMKNSEEVQPYIEEFSNSFSDGSIPILQKDWNSTFIKWFKTKVGNMSKYNNSEEMNDLLSLAWGPSTSTLCYKGCVINGFRFHTQDHEKGLRTQNSGVVVIGNNGVDVDSIDYYGVLREIIELQDGVVKDPAALEKLDEIKNKVAEMPNASTFELIETVFGEQKHGNVVCLGGGVKAKDFTQKSSKKAELINKLRRSEEEKEILRNDAEKQKQRMDEVEAQMVNMRAQMQALINAQQG